jgi:hypothetical protein
MHTRAEAEEPGHLVDLMKPPYADIVEEAGYRLPVAITREAFDRYVRLDAEAEAAGLDANERLWNVLWMSRAAKNVKAAPGSVVPFQVIVHRYGEVTLTSSIRELADGPYVLIAMPPQFAHLVIEDGELRVVRAGLPTYGLLTTMIGGGIEGVPIPMEGVIGYCHNNGYGEGLGANCYVIGMRHPIPGLLVVVGIDDQGGHRPLTEAEIRAFSMKALPGRPLPTLCVRGVRENHQGVDPATGDPYLPGEPMEPPEATITW